MLVLQHLQLGHTQHQQSRKKKNPEAGRDHAVADNTGLPGDVLYGMKRLHNESDNK